MQQRAISLVVAMDENRLIGRQGRLPWRLPDDLRHFKRITLGKTVLMGRKTWESLGGPLSERRNWVVTRDRTFHAEGCEVFGELSAALDAHDQGELMIIGGGEIYRQVLPLAERIYLTQVHARLEGDAWFPPLASGEWRETARDEHPADERHAYPFSFITLERV